MQTMLLQRPEGTVAYDDTLGQGPLVICVPSMGDLRAEYRFLRDRLQKDGYRVVTMDIRGHGESSTKWSDYSAAAVGSDIVALARHLNAGPAAVIGTSMASAAAVWAAAEAPELVSQIVLVGPFARDLPGTLVQRLGLAVMLAGPWRIAAWVAFYRTLYPSIRPADFESYQRRLKANLAEPGRFDALRGMLAAPKGPCSARMPEVSARTLVVMGTRDPDFPSPAAEAEWLAAQIQGRTLMVEGAGHYPHAEMPDQVAPAISKFLREGGAAHAS